ncbi:MAG: translation initiation factor IF-2 [Desulfovibrio sp.]|nr:translation initiation factor IF-2 [Desulfovibrio sp.]
MKLPFVATIVAFIRSHVILLASILLIILIAAGAYTGWRHYQYRQTAEFAFLRFKDALQPVNLDVLVDFVDFNGLTMPLARNVSKKYPFLRKGPHQEAQLNDMIETAIFQQTRLKEEPPKDIPDAETRLKTPLYAMPPDFLTQLCASLTLAEHGEQTALMTATVHHQLLNRDFALRLRMDHTQEGWRLRSLANAKELVEQFREAQVERMNGQRQLLVDKNNRTKQRMQEVLPINNCTASAALLSDGKTLLVGVSVDAKNMDQVAVSSINLSSLIIASQGQELLHRYLNAVVPVMPQQPLHHSWTIEMDKESPEAKAILAAGQLTCKAAWQTIGLSSGEVLHIIEVPEPIEEFQ